MTAQPSTPVGAPLPAGQKYCIACGNVLDARAELCPACGVRQPGGASGYVTDKSRVSAAILAFFLGGFGAHKFYLGQTGKGVLYLLFFWTLVPAIVAFVEFLILITMSDDAFAQKYGRPVTAQPAIG